MSQRHLGRRGFVKLAAGDRALRALARARPGAAAAAAGAGFPKRPEKKKALFVYGGWPGHEPAKCRDIFVPWLQAKRLRGGGLRHAGALRRRRAHGDDRPRGADLDHGHDREGAAQGPARRRQERHRHGRLARRHGRRLPPGDRVPLHGGRRLGRAPGRHHRLRRADHRRRGPDHGGPLRLQDQERAVPDARQPEQQGARHHHLRRRRSDPWIDGYTMPVAWKKVYGKGRIFYTSLGHTADVFDIPRGAHDRAARHAVGEREPLRAHAEPGEPVYPRR